MAEGLLNLDATVLSYFPELDNEITDRRSRSMLVAMWPRWPVGIWRTLSIERALDPVRTCTRIPAHTA